MKKFEVDELICFSRSYCCYGNLLYKKDDHNLFTKDWAYV